MGTPTKRGRLQQHRLPHQALLPLRAHAHAYIYEFFVADVGRNKYFCKIL